MVLQISVAGQALEALVTDEALSLCKLQRPVSGTGQKSALPEGAICGRPFARGRRTGGLDNTQP